MDLSGLQKYNKFFVALAGALSVAVNFSADGEFSLNDLLGTLSALLAALGVYAVPNKPSGTPGDLA